MPYRLASSAIAASAGLLFTCSFATAQPTTADAPPAEVSAASFGFDPADSTDAIQAAIETGARRVIIPYVGRPWIIRPIRLRSHLELVFEPGVLVLAKKDEFRGKGDSLFRAVDATDIIVRGYGATLRMRKRDYQRPPYEKAEWRMGVSFAGCKRVRLEGLTIESSGGDGIYIGSSGRNRWCEDVVIRDCKSIDNHRQGISVISAVNLLIENCLFAHTDGTPPEAGIDLEPDSPDERLVNITVRNCRFESNSGHAILVYLRPLTRESAPVSILFENCISRMGAPGMEREDFTDDSMLGWSGMAVGAGKDSGPRGWVEFRNCTAENTGKEGAKVFDKSADSVRVRFINCRWKNAWLSKFPQYEGPRSPVLIHLRRPEFTIKPGGVEFIDCTIYDDQARPAIKYMDDSASHALHDVKGSIRVASPSARPSELGDAPVNVGLEITRE